MELQLYPMKDQGLWSLLVTHSQFPKTVHEVSRTDETDL